MEKVTPRQQRVLDALDEEISDLEAKLAKYQPYFDELTKLKRTRMTLLSERSVTGAIRNGTRLTMETVIQAFRDADEEQLSVGELAQTLGVDETVVRSHLNRYKDERYRSPSRGIWELIGNDNTEDEDDD